MKTQATSIRSQRLAAVVLIAALIGGGAIFAPHALAGSSAEGDVDLAACSELSVSVASERPRLNAGITYSGDDPYDPAAGGLPELSVNVASERPRLNAGITYSGDDPYDPAAGGLPVLSVNVASERPRLNAGITYSGDDPYDPAAGGRPELSVIALAADDGYDLAVGVQASLVDVAWRGTSSSADLAANPELIIARRYVGGAALETNRLAANPELIAARNYSAARFERITAASAARWAAMDQFYADQQAERYERAAAASSARWAAMANAYLGGLVVCRPADDSRLAFNPELKYIPAVEAC
jgi:hypothetical protein